MIDIKDVLYLEWIFNRLLYRFKDKEEYIRTGRNILKKITNPKLNIENNLLDKILSKYFIDFNLHKTESIGYSDTDREALRNNIKSIIQDIIDQKIPKDHEILIK
jgi:hypothetical protein